MTDTNVSHAAGPISPPDLGERLREARRTTGISLRELARRIDVSPSLISQIETGKIHPSVSTLYAIASELDASLDQLLFRDDARSTASSEAAAEAVAGHPNLPPVLQGEDRQVIRLSSGVEWERLTAESAPGVDFLHVTYPPGSESSPADEMQRHPGREWGYVTSGTLRVTIAFNDYVLGPRGCHRLRFDGPAPPLQRRRRGRPRRLVRARAPQRAPVGDQPPVGSNETRLISYSSV